MNVLNEALALFQQGFDTVNSIQGLIIALASAFLMREYRQIIAWTFIATLLHEMINAGRRIVEGVPNPLPNLSDVDGDLKLIAIRFAGYMVAITLLYGVRRVALRR